MVSALLVVCAVLLSRKHGCALYHTQEVLFLGEVFEWIEMFSEGWMCVTDVECSGHSSTSARDKMEEVRVTVIGDRSITVAELHKNQMLS
jgi:hypothetical protein